MFILPATAKSASGGGAIGRRTAGVLGDQRETYLARQVRNGTVAQAVNESDTRFAVARAFRRGRRLRAADRLSGSTVREKAASTSAVL